MELCFWYNTFCKYSLLYHATDNKKLMPNIDFVENVFYTVGIGLRVIVLSQEKLKKIEMSFVMMLTSKLQPLSNFQNCCHSW